MCANLKILEDKITKKASRDKKKSQKYDSQAHVNSDSGISLKPILRNSNGNMLALQSLQPVPSNFWLPANSRSYQNMYGLDENSRSYQNMYGLDE